MNVKTLAAGAAVLLGAFGLFAEANLDWKWDGSARSVPAPAVTSASAFSFDSLFVTSAESAGGAVYLGLLLFIR